MGILRATKHKTFLKLSAAVFLLSTILISSLVPLTASADVVPPTAPLYWLDNAHGSAVDSSGNLYLPVNYACAIGAISLTDSTGTKISGDSATNGTKSVNVETETGSKSQQVKVPNCANGAVAVYVWISTNTTNHYALLVHSPDTKTQLDPRYCPISTSTGCFADVWNISTGGVMSGSAIPKQITKMTVDSTKLTLSNAVSGTASETTQTSDITCSKSITNPLTWIVCPLVSAASDAVGVFDGQITCLMQVDLTDVFGNGSNANNPLSSSCGTASNTSAGSNGSFAPSDAYFKAWSTFRAFALAIMVIAGLVMVVSQALGFELLDAYTIRKVLPRLLIAGVGITLSWQIMEFLIQITNALGYAIRDIIYAPFSSFSGVTISGLGSSFASSLLVGGAMVSLGLAGLGMFALTALLAVLVAFVTLVLRKMIIIFLLMMAPFAIACFILPNTQKVWKLWWDTLSKALLMFPIIAGMIAVGHVFAATTQINSDTNNVTTQIIAFIAYFIPYFFIPTAVRMAGGAVGSIGGMVSKASQGGFSGLKKRRAGIMQERRHNAGIRVKSGDVVRGRFAKSTAGSLINRGTQGVSTGYKGRFGLGDRGEAATDAFRDDATTQFMKTSQFTNNANNDNVLRAAAVGRNRAEAVTNLQKVFGYSQDDAEKYAKQAEATFGYGQAQRQAAAMQLVSTGTGYDNIQQMTETLGLASNGNANTASRLAGFANADTKNRGRYDLAPSFGTLNKLVLGAAGISGAEPNAQSYHAATVKAARGVDPVSLLRGKPTQVKYLTQSLSDHLDANWRRQADTTLSAADRSAAMDEVLITTAQIKGLNDSKGYASQENQELVNVMSNDTAGIRTNLIPLVTPATRSAPSGPYNARWEQLAPPLKNPNDPNLP